MTPKKWLTISLYGSALIIILLAYGCAQKQ